MKLHLGYILGLFAIALAASAGYISVVGWGKLFAGEATIVMVVMGIIEAAKIVTTIYLHRYNVKSPRPEGTNWFIHTFKNLFSLKTYLVVGVIATMFLTSVGIYGFLTGAYQETANKMEIHDGEVLILEGKKEIFEIKITDNNSVIETKNSRVKTLSDLRVQQEVRLDSLLVNEHWTNAKKTRKDIEDANKEIQKLTNDVDLIVEGNSTLRDSVSSYQVKILELKGASDVSAEIGPLKYISSLTGRPMGSIINWIVLVIIFIFDPMAISLVLASNKVFDMNSNDDDDNDDDSNNDSGGDWRPTTPLVDVRTNMDGSEDIKVYMDDKSSNIEELVDTETGEINLPEEPLPMETDIWVGQGEEIIEPEPSGTTNEVESIEVVRIQESEEKGNLRDIITEKPNPKPAPQKIDEPEEQIAENKQKIKETITQIEEDTNSEVKQSPVVPTGNVKREEIKEIKEGTRGYSVNVPEPTKVGTNKEVRDGDPKKFYFRRPR